MISWFTLLICSLLLKWRHKKECLQQLHSFISQTLQRLQASLVQSLLTGLFWKNHSWSLHFHSCYCTVTLHARNYQALCLNLRGFCSFTWNISGMKLGKKKNPVPSSVQQNQIFLLGLPFLWHERQRSTHFSVLDISLGIQDLGRAFFISATRNIAFEVQSYIFKKKVLILVLQEVERLQ